MWHWAKVEGAGSEWQSRKRQSVATGPVISVLKYTSSELYVQLYNEELKGNKCLLLLHFARLMVPGYFGTLRKAFLCFAVHELS